MAQENRPYGRSHRQAHGIGGLIGAFLETIRPNAGGAVSRAHPAGRRQENGSVALAGGTSSQPTSLATEIHKRKNRWPYLIREGDRRQSILTNTPANIAVADNPEASAAAPLYAIDPSGILAVQHNWRLISEEARRANIDPDLVRAIIYVENAQGGAYGQAAEALDEFDHMSFDLLPAMTDSFLPMNVRRSLWQELIGPDQDLRDPQTNIRAGSMLLSRIADRLPNPTTASIATLYNQLSADAVNDFGARVADVYRNKPWLNDLDAPMVP